jgi:hypothetical protein
MDEIRKSVPELFYDLIARIVPGTIILGIISLHYPNQHLESYGFLLWLVVGYVIGYATEAAAELADKILFGSVLKWAWAKCPRFASERILWDYAFSDVCRNYPLWLKVLAERSMFRTLFLACLATSVFLPARLDGMRWIPIVGAILMANGYVALTWYLSKEIATGQQRSKAIQ